MFNILEATNYNDSWSITFYYVLVLILLIGIFWTYIQVFVKPLRKKKQLKENVIYQHSYDVIEDSDKYNQKKKKNTNNNKKNTKKKN